MKDKLIYTLLLVAAILAIGFAIYQKTICWDIPAAQRSGICAI